MPNLRSKMPEGRQGRVYFEGAVHNATWSCPAWLSDYEVMVILENGRQLQVSDENEDLGFIFREPDQGLEMTNIMVLLGPDEAEPVGIPDQSEIAKKAFEAMRPIFESVARQETHHDDLDYCRQLFTNQAALLRTIQKTGSLASAHAAILRDVFRL